MASQREMNRSYSKLAQIHNSYQAKYPKANLIKNILLKEGDINFKIPSSSCINSPKLNLTGCTSLHIAALKSDKEICDLLLSYNADFTVENQKGHSALHCAHNQSKPSRELIDALLSAHLLNADPSNPCDKNGLSHFHIACKYNRADVVRFFLNNLIPVDMAVKIDSQKFAGYSPLHIAAENIAILVICVLLKHNARINVKDARGLTPFHLLLDEKIKLLNSNIEVSDDTIAMIDYALNMLMDNNFVDDIGLTHFHIACTQRFNTSVVEYFLKRNYMDIDHSVKVNSSFYPGYTALHFAAQCNLKIVEMLLKMNANLGAKDANGVTPMDILWWKCDDEELHKIVQQNWSYVTFSDQQTRLVDFFNATRDDSQLIDYLENINDITTRIGEVPSCLSGCTLLHIAVMLFRGSEVMETCMQQGFNVLVDVQDAYGSTPIHHAFRMKRFNTVGLLMKYCETHRNLTDSYGLSYLKIASELNIHDRIGLFALDINCEVVPWTILQVVMKDDGYEHVIDLLLQNGLLDLDVKDANGLTSIERFFQLHDIAKEVCDVLLKSPLLTDRMLDAIGVTKLHLAVYSRNSNIREFINPTSINAIVKCRDPLSFLHIYDGCTALHMAMKMRDTSDESSCSDVVKNLLDNGADLLAKNCQGDTPLYEALTRKIELDTIVRMLQHNEALRRQMEEVSGITMLHLDCHMINGDAVGWLLSGQVNVNAKVRLDCKIWPGYTPLHLLMTNIESTADGNYLCGILTMMLAAGADVADTNENGETPIHFALRDFSNPCVYTVVEKLVDNLRIFNVNPVGQNGMSHFHAACLVNNIDAVKLFLENGVDVNQPIDFFAKNLAGETPLHLASNYQTEALDSSRFREEVIDVLLAKNADVEAEDSHGQTAVHKAVKLKDNLSILKKLIERGATINARNIFQQTPLDMLLRSENVSSEKIKFFENYGCRLNESHPLTEEGYISIIVSKNYHKEIQMRETPEMTTITECFLAMLDAVDSSVPDDMGRNLIHNIVTTNDPYVEIFSYDDLIKRFQAAGVDVDLQDKKGKTALHLAAQFGNISAVSALLDNGADINVLDATKKTALNYAIDYHNDEKYCPEKKCHKKVIACMIRHVDKLQKFNLELNRSNFLQREKALSNIVTRGQIYGSTFDNMMQVMRSISKARSIEIDDQPLLYVEDFLSETGKGLIAYPFMSDTRRERVDNFFIHNCDNKLKDVCALQYRKAVKRVKILKSVMENFSRIAADSIILPVVCIEKIVQYLTNSDLENFIKGTTMDNR